MPGELEENSNSVILFFITVDQLVIFLYIFCFLCFIVCFFSYDFNILVCFFFQILNFFCIGVRKWQATSVFLPGKSHGERNLSGNSLWSYKELDTT